MEPTKAPPMEDYMVKMMLLEAVKCHKEGDEYELEWIRKQMFKFNIRLRELAKRD